MSIFDLINKVGKADAALQEQTIVAPVVVGSTCIKTRVAGMVREFQIRKQRSVGLKLFKPTSTTHARYVSDADEDQYREYLSLLPKLQLIAVYQLDGVWYGYPCHHDAFKRYGAPTLVAIRKADPTVDQFDTIIARYDGVVFWYDDVDYRVDPDKQDALRDALSQRDWSRVRRSQVDDPAIYEVAASGLTAEDRIAYQIAARRIIQDSKSTIEQRLEEDLQDVRASLDSFVERGDNIEVRWVNSSGQGYTTVVHREDFKVVTAGICVSGEDRKFDLKSLVGVVNYAESQHRIVRVGHGHMEEGAYFDVHPEPDELGRRGNGAWNEDL